MGYEFLKEFNPHIDWTPSTVRFSDMEIVQAIMTKRTADVKHLSGKQISSLLNKEFDKTHLKVKYIFPEPDD